MTSPTFAVSPGFFRSSVIVPAAGAGSSMEAFSLSSTTTGSSRWTESPFCLSQLPISTSETDSPAAGILSSIGISGRNQLRLFGLVTFVRPGCRTRGRRTRDEFERMTKDCFAEFVAEVTPRAHVLGLFLHPHEGNVRCVGGQGLLQLGETQRI